MRSSEELRKLGIANQKAIVNGVIPEDERMHPYSLRRWQRQQPFLRAMGRRFHGPLGQMPLYPEEVKGLAMLRQVGEDLQDAIAL